MFVDASAIVAMMTDEDQARTLAVRLESSATRLTSAVAVFEATAAVASILPKSLRAKNCGSVRSEMFASDDEVAKAASLMSEEAEREEERRLAAEARDRALAGGQAALGWEETLQCLREGRVHQVLIGGSEAGTPKGDEAFDLAWETGAGIEVVHHEGEEILRPYDGVGALLRY